jgi:hypothetical protein
MAMNDDFDGQSFVFSCAEENKTLVKQQAFEFGTPWPSVLESFLEFLEAVGYIGVRDKVRIEDNPFVESSWTLDTYDKEEAPW